MHKVLNTTIVLALVVAATAVSIAVMEQRVRASCVPDYFGDAELVAHALIDGERITCYGWNIEDLIGLPPKIWMCTNGDKYFDKTGAKSIIALHAENDKIVTTEE